MIYNRGWDTKQPHLMTQGRPTCCTTGHTHPPLRLFPFTPSTARSMRRILTLLCTVCLLAACSDSEVQDYAVWHVTYDDGSLTLSVPREAGFQRATIQVQGVPTGTAVTVVCHEEWLTLYTDTLPADGIATMLVQRNDDDAARTATLYVVPGGDETQAVRLSVTQRSTADDDGNGADPRDCLYLGYGYDIYQQLDNPMSVRTLEPVLDYDRLVALGKSHTYETVHECRLSQTTMQYYNASSLAEFSTKLTSSSSKTDLCLQGSQRDCDIATASCAGQAYESLNYGYGAMIKAVAARVIDAGALRDLKQAGLLPFSEGFLKAYRKAKALSGKARADAVTNILLTYGTHVVVQTDLGGRLSYTFTMNKSESIYTNKEMQQEVDYTMGRLSESERDKDLQKETTSEKNNGLALRVTGGDPTWNETIARDIKGLGRTAQIPPDHIMQWLASICYEENPGRSDKLDVVHFELEPLWNLVDESMRVDFINATLQLMQRSDCQLSDRFLGTDLYRLDLQALGLTDFDHVGDTGSLARLLYIKSGSTSTPVLEACSEYVPHIRTDRRVTVVYPIFKGNIKMNRGLFLGDGAHKPAMVGFSEGDCLVTPIDTLLPGHVISTLYYINGNLYTSPNGISISAPADGVCTVTDDELILNLMDESTSHRHGVVKIGSTFWTRHDMDHSMRFTFYPDDDNEDDLRETFRGDVLFTRFQAEVGYWFNYLNKWCYGYAPVTSLRTQPNTLWYLPTPNQVKQLYAYIGFNPKALFRGQCSGFNAAFNGYVGTQDILNGNTSFPASGTMQQHEQGRLNVISSKSTKDMADACLLVLDDHYTLREINDQTANKYWRLNYYPIRLCRGAFYQYPTLETIQKHTR